MGLKIFLTILMGFSMGALADNHEIMEPSPPTEAIPAMDEKPPLMNMNRKKKKKRLIFSGDFAGSYSIFSNQQDPHGDFDINLAQFKARVNRGPSRFNLGFGYGSTVRGLDPERTTNKLGLLNAFYQMKTSYGLGFMMGRFESPVGHETYNHRMNSQFTRSYGFDLAPYFSTGLGVNYRWGFWRVGLVVTNGRGADTDLDDGLTMAATVDFDPMKSLHLDFRYVMGVEGDGTNPTGNEDREDTEELFADLSSYSVGIMDASISYKINRMFNVALNYISNTITPEGSEGINSMSLAAYLNARYGSFDFGLRYEQFQFDLARKGGALHGLLYNGSRLGLRGEGVDNSIGSLTVTAKKRIAKNTGLLFEYRMDGADDITFSNAEGEDTDSFNRITLALMHKF